VGAHEARRKRKWPFSQKSPGAKNKLVCVKGGSQKSSSFSSEKKGSSVGTDSHKTSEEFRHSGRKPWFEGSGRRKSTPKVRESNKRESRRKFLSGEKWRAVRKGSDIWGCTSTYSKGRAVPRKLENVEIHEEWKDEPVSEVITGYVTLRQGVRGDGEFKRNWHQGQSRGEQIQVSAVGNGTQNEQKERKRVKHLKEGEGTRHVEGIQKNGRTIRNFASHTV